jgi:glycine betaine/proline transport system ATP-binding protein
MTPVEQIERRGDDLQLDWSGHHLLRLNGSGQPDSVTIEGKPGKLVAYRPDLDLAGIAAACDTIVTAAADIRMKTAIEIRHITGRPVALMEDGRMIGVIGDDEIYRGMLRQTAMSDKKES